MEKATELVERGGQNNVYGSFVWQLPVFQVETAAVMLYVFPPLVQHLSKGPKPGLHCTLLAAQGS